MNISAIKSSVNSVTKTLSRNSSHNTGVIETTADICHSEQTKTKTQKIVNKITAYITPILKKIEKESPSASTICETFRGVKKNISKANKESLAEGKSRIKGTLSGISDSKGIISNGLKEIAGINDVILAKQEAGTGRAILESGKSTVRLAISSALSAICAPIPIPGAVVGGWVAGEKLAEKLVGKPYSRQLPRLK